MYYAVGSYDEWVIIARAILDASVAVYWFDKPATFFLFLRLCYSRRGDGMARRKLAKAVTPGSRTGTKRSDFRLAAPDGTIWASRFRI